MRARRHRGTAMVLMVVIATILAGLVMSLSWAAGVQSQVTSRMVKVDQAYYAAESGVQHAAWYIKNGKTATQPLTGTINCASYSVTWTSSGSAYKVTSVGTNGAAQQTLSVVVTPPVTGVQAAYSIANSLSLKNLTITGNVIVGQDITFQPGNAQIIGDLTYGTNLNGSADVSGTTAKGTWSGVNWTSMGTTLISKAGTTYNGAQSNKTFDFSSLPGSKVIYVNGDVTNPTFVGSGTLYVNGKITLNGDVGTSANPVNLVATSDITTANNSTVYGGLYTQTQWNRGKIDLTGSVYVGGSMNQSNNGASTITFTSTPWFDNRTGGGGGVVITPTQFTSFGGPNP